MRIARSPARDSARYGCCKGQADLQANANIVLITLIHNPGAGDDDQPDGSALEALVRSCGHKVRYQSTRESTWSGVLDETVDLVAVAGGDGTVGRVAKKLIGRRIPVAPLPLGTANNISRTLGIAELALPEIIAGWRDGHLIRFDAGIAHGPWGTRYFIEGVGVGLFACAIPEADRNRTLASLSDAEAKVAYALDMLRRRLEDCPPHRIALTLDDVDFSGEYVLLEAMNMEFIGPNLYLAPQVLPDDGMLDVVLVTARDRDRLEESLASWQNGELRHPRLARRRASRVALEWTGYDVHFDDEAWPDGKADLPRPTRIELGVERDALAFLAPAGASPSAAIRRASGEAPS
jgi:diacylglycerol kinase (ATP)